MLYRIKDILCHPSRIGLYYKDSLLKTISILAIFCLVFVGLSFIVMTNADYFSMSSAKGVSSDLMNDNSEVTIAFVDNNISGDAYTFKGDDYIISFLDDSFKPQKNYISISFKANTINVYIDTTHYSTIYYDRITITDFKLANVIDGVVKDRIAFQSLVNVALDSIEYSYGVFVFLENMAVVLGLYVCLVIIAVVLAYFVNPEINMSYRLRLALYDTAIYFVIMIFSLLYNQYWLQYLAIILALIYVKITFSHIIRVKIKRNVGQ